MWVALNLETVDTNHDKVRRLLFNSFDKTHTNPKTTNQKSCIPKNDEPL